MKYTDKEHYTYRCLTCHRTLYDNENPEAHVKESGHVEFLVEPHFYRIFHPAPRLGTDIN
jgi:hypothetical protein